MALIEEKNVTHIEDGRSSVEKAGLGSPVDEKSPNVEVSSDEVSFDARDGDEALELVGMRRTAQFSEEYNNKLRRKLDYTIPPLCAAVYFTQFLDKNSLNYASIMGLPITGQEYNLVALAFYLGFLLWEFPTVYISQKLRLAKYLGCNVVLWGVVLMLQAVPNTFGPFFALRILLGMLESCVAPILILIISMFYKKNEQTRRISWFYVMNGLTNIFGGFVAYGISFDQTKGFAPYKILFLLLGALAIVVGVAVLIWMPDSPVHAPMLTREERIAAIERVRDDQGGTENKTIKKAQIIEALLDIRTWLIVISTLVTSIPNGGLSNFSAIIVKSFGYTSRQALILSAPGGAIAAFATLTLGWYSDKRNERMVPIVLSMIPTIVGTAMLVGLNDSDKKGALLFASWIVGFYGCSLAILYAYNASNTSGHTKKATVNAMTLASFALGNVIGTETFLPKDAPDYLPGKISILVLLGSQFILCFIIRFINLRLNKKKRAHIAALKERNGWTDEDIQREREKHAFLDLTDIQNPYFVYTA
ncbi:MFS general substrate transporter [Fomitiporia mediterranea MF3/22]|uniref:MFS general substrate transporter n=1 Tax=Fomitiporia mediterranea (strain MF3/22) TaxID=694068 RepID=UPI0004407771|nr:MFS general substrate transporter [Fomitiporia mediterranea MF3/22]EJD01337.1 MFS general substrate transporter [Fomitiporia mediterranea MF3/22]